MTLVVMSTILITCDCGCKSSQNRQVLGLQVILLDYEIGFGGIFNDLILFDFGQGLE